MPVTAQMAFARYLSGGAGRLPRTSSAACLLPFIPTQSPSPCEVLYMKSLLFGPIMWMLFAVNVVFAQSTSTSPVTMVFPSTPVGTFWDTSFMVYASGMTYGTNYRLYIIPSTGYQVSWSPSGSFQSSLMLQLATTMSYQSWCYMRYTPTSANMIGTLTVRLTYGHPTYAFIFESQMGLNQVLPVQLASLSATFRASQNEVLVSWKTLSETANYGFEIERKVEGESTFTMLPAGFVPGHGTVLVPQEYEFADRCPVAGRAQYRLKQIDLDGTVYYSEPVTVEAVTGIAEGIGVPAGLELMQNHPNPFNPSTTIRYGLPAQAHVTLTVFNSIGQQVAVLQNGEMDAGYHEVQFDAHGLPSGVYYYRLQGGAHSHSKKLLLLR